MDAFRSEDICKRSAPRFLSLGFLMRSELYSALSMLTPAAFSSIAGDTAAPSSHSTYFPSSVYALVLLIPHWGAVIAGMFLFLSWTCFSLPATFSLVAAALTADRYSMGIGVQSTIKRVPLMVAPFLGGILIDRFGIINGVRIGLAVSILLSGLAILLQRRLPADPSHMLGSADRWSFWASLRSFNAPLRRLLVSDILIRFCERIPFAWVVIYSMDYVGATATTVGALTTVEMLAATLCIIPASHFADKFGREPFVITTFIIFTLFPVSLWLAHGIPMLAIAFALRGLKEFGDTSRKALIIGYCEPRRRGQMIGAYYLTRDLLVAEPRLQALFFGNSGHQ